MDINTINDNLSRGQIDQPGIFPHLDHLQKAQYIFQIDFGLDHLPNEPGILLIRGARQYGKSTWLEQQIYHTIKQFGRGTAYYLNGDNIPDSDSLESAIEQLCYAYPHDAAVRRLFIY